VTCFSASDAGPARNEVCRAIASFTGGDFTRLPRQVADAPGMRPRLMLRGVSHTEGMTRRRMLARSATCRAAAAKVSPAIRCNSAADLISSWPCVRRAEARSRRSRRIRFGAVLTTAESTCPGRCLDFLQSRVHAVHTPIRTPSTITKPFVHGNSRFPGLLPRAPAASIASGRQSAQGGTSRALPKKGDGTPKLLAIMT